MNTHNIGFYEEVSKIITYLSSNIIKYPPYFICREWTCCKTIDNDNDLFAQNTYTVNGYGKHIKQMTWASAENNNKSISEHKYE